MIAGLGGAGAISAGFRVYLNDDFSRNADRITSKLKAMRNETAMLRENLIGAKRMYTGLATAAFAATAGMVKLAMRGADYGFEMSKVKAITSGSVKEMKALNKEAKRLAGQTIFRPTEVASAMTFAARTGQSAGTILNTISPATYLAAATDTPLGGKGGAMDIQTNIMKGFSIPESRMTEVADILTNASLSANTNIVDLGRAIKYTAATSMDMATTMKESTAMIMVLGDNAMQASQAGTAVENMQRYFARALGPFATGAQRKAFSMMGLSAQDFKNKDGSRKEWTTIFKLINKKSAGLDPLIKQPIFEKIFGVRGKRAGSVFVRKPEAFQSMLEDLGNSEGMAKTTAIAMMDNLKGSWEKLISEFDSFAASWSEAVGPLLQFVMWVARGILKVANTIISTPVLGFLISSIMMVGSAALALRWSFKALAMTIATISGPRASIMGMRGAANGWIGGARSSMGFGRSYETAGRATYSSKRGMFYSISPGGGARAQTRGARFSHTGFARAGSKSGSLGIMGGFGKLGKIGKYLGMGVRFLGRMLPFLGPILLALEIFGPLLRDLGGKLVDLLNSTDENTRALAAQYEMFKGTGIIPAQAFNAAYADKTMAEIVQEIIPIVKSLEAQGYTQQEILDNGFLDVVNSYSDYEYSGSSNPAR